MKLIISIAAVLFIALSSQAQHEGHKMPPPPPKKETAKPPVKKTAPKKQVQKKATPAKKKTPVVKKTDGKQPADSMQHHHRGMKEHDMGDPQMDDRQLNEPEFQYKGTVVNMAPGKTVRYDLYITDTMVNFTGKLKHAFAINGTIPGPDLVFTEGDTAEIYLHNRLKNEETSLHWHGVILPNRFDGVPYLTTAPVHPGDVHLYKFKVVQNGTYWYHSHSGLQEQAGIYGALIFHKRPGQDDLVKHDDHNMHFMQNDTGTKEMDHSMHQQMKDTSMQKKDEHAGHDMNNMKMPASGMKGMDHGSMQMVMPVKGDGSYNKEQTIVLSEWTDEDPDQVQRRLRTVNDWYAIKKGSTQSYSEAVAAGHLGTKITNEWKRMNAMDVSDVYYDRFLINGKTESEAPQYKAGDRVRLRIINAGASSYFWVQFAGSKLTVTGNDGNDVMPIEVDRLIIGVSETYDVVVTIPADMSYELRATPEDRTKAASFWLGSGMKMPAPVLPRLKYFEGMKMMNDMMKMNGDMKAMDMEMSLQQMDMNTVMYDELKDVKSMDHSNHTMQRPEKIDSSEVHNMIEMQEMDIKNNSITTLNYAMLQSPEKTMLPDAPVKELFFELTGNMNRYVWSINNKVVKEWDKILVEKGHNVRIVLFNNSMMRHPMHLHGHDFRVINGQGEYAPLKNVLDIMPMETDTIEFAGSQDGDWFFHCHILYHMMAGMGNVFSYKNSLPNPELPDKVIAYNKFLREQRMFHLMAEVGLESNGSDGKIMISGERYELRTEWRIGLEPHHGNEAEIYLGRYLGKMQWWYPFIGFDYHKNTRENNPEKNVFGQLSNQDNRKAFVAGIEYTLPMLVTAQARIDSKGKFRFQLGREDVPLTPRLRFNAMWNTDKEYMAGFRYILRKWLSLSTHYDSDMGYGAGITLTY